MGSASVPTQGQGETGIGKPKDKGKGKGKPRGFRRDRDCITCKARGTKCDLNRPACGPCKEHGIVCQGYVNRVKWVGGSSSSVKVQSASGASTSHHRTVSDSLPAIDTSPSTISNIVQSPTSPTSIRLHSPVDQAKKALTSPDSLTSSLDQSDDNPGWTTGIANYLRYFTSQYTQARAAHDPINAPDDAEFIGFFDVWAFAWKRISSRMNGSNNHFSVATVPKVPDDGLNQDLLYTQALQGLKRSVESGDILALFGIAVFAFLDVREGPFGYWSRHLRGARALLDVHCKNWGELSNLYQVTPGLKQAISLLNWYDVMGAIIHKDRKLVFDDFHRVEIDPVLFDLVGCPQDTYFVYVRIAEGYMATLSHEIYHVSLSQLLQLSNHTTDERLLLQDAWRYASILVALEALYPDVESEQGNSSTLIADRVCDIVERIQPKSAAYIHLPVAVYFVGIHASTEKHHRVVSQFWGYFDSHPNPSYPNAQAICNDRRQQRRSGATR
jgi:hypothetical protein